MRLCSFLLLLCLSLSSFGQNKKAQLQKERNALQKEISRANEMLKKTASNRELTANQLRALNRAIEARKKLLTTMTAEIDYLQESKGVNERKIDSLEAKIEDHKEEYAELIRQSYRSKSKTSRLMFLLSAQDFNQAYRRLRYMQDLSRHRKAKVAELKSAQEEIKNTVNLIEQEVAEKEALIEEKKEEQEKLRGEIQNKNSMVRKLQRQESSLRAEIKEKEKAARELQKEIEKAIEAELARLKAENTNSGTSSDLARTPESIALGNSFTSNQGKLPWPVERGVIVSKFGAQPHPVYPSIRVNNNGVKILTEKGAVARAAFEGTVNSILVIPGNHKAVILIHGNYLTVYSNLDEVYVTRGQKVDTKQKLGLIHTDNNNGETVLEFQIWKNTDKLNPESWLYR